MIRVVHPDPDPDFLHLPNLGVKRAPDPGSRGQKGTGSRIQGSKRHRIQDPGSGSATLHRVATLSKLTQRCRCDRHRSILQFYCTVAQSLMKANLLNLNVWKGAKEGITLLTLLRQWFLDVRGLKCFRGHIVPAGLHLWLCFRQGLDWGHQGYTGARHWFWTLQGKAPSLYYCRLCIHKKIFVAAIWASFFSFLVIFW
jgi:hypothetical protein